MKQKKCKKQKSKLTFFEFYKSFSFLNSHENFVFFELLKFYSKKVLNKSDLICFKNEKVDFDIEVFCNSWYKVLIENIPVQYITSKCYFCGVEFFINYGVFIPRQETEYIFQWILNNIDLSNKKQCLDLCCGSGAMTNSFSLFTKIPKIVGIEIDKTAYLTCIKNKTIHNTRAEFINDNIFNIDEKILQNSDLIFCNPPYISIDDKNIHISTKNDPSLALFAPDSGYYFYFKIINEWLEKITNKCDLIFEIGFNQKETIEQKLQSIKNIKFHFEKDLDDNWRILHIIKK